MACSATQSAVRTLVHRGASAIFASGAASRLGTASTFSCWLPYLHAVCRIRLVPSNEISLSLRGTWKRPCFPLVRTRPPCLPQALLTGHWLPTSLLEFLQTFGSYAMPCCSRRITQFSIMFSPSCYASGPRMCDVTSNLVLNSSRGRKFISMTRQ